MAVYSGAQNSPVSRATKATLSNIITVGAYNKVSVTI